MAGRNPHANARWNGNHRSRPSASAATAAFSVVASTAAAMVEHCRQHPDLLTMYGSVYLGEWRGPELVDRINY
jgi:hypothetical protein